MFLLLLITAWPLLLISPGRPPELREAIEGHVSVVVNLAFAAYTRTSSNLSLLRREYEYCKLFAMAARAYHGSYHGSHGARTRTRHGTRAFPAPPPAGPPASALAAVLRY